MNSSPTVLLLVNHCRFTSSFMLNPFCAVSRTLAVSLVMPSEVEASRECLIQTMALRGVLSKNACAYPAMLFARPTTSAVETWHATSNCILLTNAARDNLNLERLRTLIKAGALSCRAKSRHPENASFEIDAPGSSLENACAISPWPRGAPRTIRLVTQRRRRVASLAHAWNRG
jgi:hypothetical protein